MPQRMWDHSQCCGDFSAGTPECRDGRKRGRYAGWRLATDERMARYQHVYGLKPIGPHRPLADELLTPLRATCPRCEYEGILNFYQGRLWLACPDCQGTGGSWVVPDGVVQATRATVLEAYPDASAPPVRFLGAALIRKFPENIMIDCDAFRNVEEDAHEGE
jgi:hypothetical protein